MANSNFGLKKNITNAVWAALLKNNFSIKIDWFSQYGTTKSIESEDSVSYISVSGATLVAATHSEKECYQGGDGAAGIAPSNSKDTTETDNFETLKLAYANAENKVLFTVRSNTFGVEEMSASVIIGGVALLVYNDADCYNAADNLDAIRQFDVPSRFISILQNQPSSDGKGVAQYFSPGYFVK